MNAGTIFAFEGIEVVKSWENCIFFPVSKNIGDTIHDTGSWGQSVALLHFTYDTEDECNNIIEKLHQTFKVLDKDGNNLVNKMLNI